MNKITLTPAYGKDYKSDREACDAFTSGKDWKIATVTHPYAGRYCSVRDLDGYFVELRFNRGVMGYEDFTVVRLDEEA